VSLERKLHLYLISCNGDTIATPMILPVSLVSQDDTFMRHHAFGEGEQITQILHLLGTFATPRHPHTPSLVD